MSFVSLLPTAVPPLLRAGSFTGSADGVPRAPVFVPAVPAVPISGPPVRPLDAPAEGAYLRVGWRDLAGAPCLSAGWKDYARSTPRALVLHGTAGVSVEIAYAQITSVDVRVHVQPGGDDPVEKEKERER